jgi:hypothetical protein
MARKPTPNWLMLMGDELGQVYHELWQEMGRLGHKWSEFVVLYGTKESRVTLMNEAASRFFRMIQDTLLESVMIHIARLTDESETKPKFGPARQNLTIKQLPQFVTDKDTLKKLNKAIDVAVKASAFARDWRNRQIAHGDLSLALDDSPPEPLAPASRLKVRKAFEALTEVMNVVSKHYDDRTNMFIDSSLNDGAMDLIHVLDDGVKAHRARIARAQSGDAHPDDWKPRDL